MKPAGLYPILLSIMLLYSVAWGQHHSPKLGQGSINVPKAAYTIRAEVLPDSSKLRGDLELTYRNFSDDTLSEVFFRLDLNAYQPDSYMERRYLEVRDSSLRELRPNQRGYCRIDSILYLGEPIGAEQLSYDNTVLRVTLPTKLPPGGTGFFLMAFESKLPGDGRSTEKLRAYLQFTNWHPEICVYKDGVWFNRQYFGWNDPPSEYAHFSIALKIDTTYSIAHSGKLLNEKEHYGFLPKADDDTVYVDIGAQHGVGLGGRRYQPVFEGGIKEYFIESPNTTGFSFVVAKRFTRDRTYVDSLTIEVCYHNRARVDWQALVARSSRLLVRQMERWLGRFPHNYLTIVAGDTAHAINPSGPLVILSEGIKDRKVLLAALAVGIASCWFSPVLSVADDNQQFYDEGLAYYTAVMTLRQLYGNDAVKMVNRYEEWIRKNASVARLFKRDLRWLSACGRPAEAETDLIAGDIALLQEYLPHVFRRAPSQVYMLRSYIGSQLMWRSLRSCAGKFRYDLPYKKDLDKTIEKVGLSIFGWYFSQWDDPDASYDLAVKDVKTTSIPGGYEVKYEIESKGSVLLPTQVGFVTSVTDTTYVTLRYYDFVADSGVYLFTATLEERPRAIVLDPNHYLWDVNRYNNYYFHLPVRYRYQEPRNLFPCFKEPWR